MEGTGDVVRKGGGRVRNYLPKSCGLPRALGNQVLWLVKDYARMKEEYDNAIWDSPEPPDGQPRGDNLGDPTSREGLKRAELFRKLQAVEQAKLAIPHPYREGVYNHVAYGVPYPKEGAHRKTWWEYKIRFIRKVAENMYWI